MTVLRKLNEHWFEARHDNGRVGLCPVSFVELIVSTSPTSPSQESPKPQPPPQRQSSLSQETPTTPSVASTDKHTYANVPTHTTTPTSTRDIRSAADTVLPCTSDLHRSDDVHRSSAGAVAPTPCNNNTQPADTLTPSVNSKSADTFTPSTNKATVPHTPTESRSTTTRPSKPCLKPKPQLGPKPTLNKTVSVGNEAYKSSGHAQMNRKSLSIDADTSITTPASSGGNKRLSMPMFSQLGSNPGGVLDSSLDDIIQNELRSASGAKANDTTKTRTWSSGEN